MIKLVNSQDIIIFLFDLQIKYLLNEQNLIGKLKSLYKFKFINFLINKLKIKIFLNFIKQKDRILKIKEKFVINLQNYGFSSLDKLFMLVSRASKKRIFLIFSHKCSMKFFTYSSTCNTITHLAF